MRWSSRTLAAALLLAGCSFHPLYGTTDAGGTSPALESIHIGKVTPAPEDLTAVGRLSSNVPRTAQMLRNDLFDRLTPRGDVAHPRYILDVILSEGRQDIVIDVQNDVTRSSLITIATYSLYEARTRSLLHTNSVRALASFDVLRATFGNVAAERDARERLARTLAESIRIELASWFSRPVVSGS